MEALLDLVMRLSRDLGREIPVAVPAAPERAEPDEAAPAPAASGRIVPRRVTVRGGARRERPPAPAGEASHLTPVGP
jgi:hypothetical protein